MFIASLFSVPVKKMITIQYSITFLKEPARKTHKNQRKKLEVFDEA